MLHNKRETRHIMRAWENHEFGGQMYRIHRKKSIQTSRNKTKINNCLDMDNNERFKNICIGFFIQFSRTTNFMNQEENQQPELVNKGLAILIQIQNSLLELRKLDKKYKNHLNNNFWCRTVMKPYVKTLEQVIADVDELVKGGVVDRGEIRKFNARELKKFRDKLNKLQDPDAFVEACAKELAARLLRMVVKRTPVGEYPKSTGKKGGTLHRGWTVGEIKKEGTVYKIDIINSVEYASYVEYGHRTANHKGWVPGHFMMTISEQELQNVTPQILENKLKKYLRGMFK